MKVIITIDTENDAFVDAGVESEVAFILADYARRLRDGLINMKLEQTAWRAPLLLRDSLGNVAGKVEVTE